MDSLAYTEFLKRYPLAVRIKTLEHGFKDNADTLYRDKNLNPTKYGEWKLISFMNPLCRVKCIVWNDKQEKQSDE